MNLASFCPIVLSHKSSLGSELLIFDTPIQSSIDRDETYVKKTNFLPSLSNTMAFSRVPWVLSHGENVLHKLSTLNFSPSLYDFSHINTLGDSPDHEHYSSARYNCY